MPSSLSLYLSVCRVRHVSHRLELAATLVTAGLKKTGLVKLSPTKQHRQCFTLKYEYSTDGRKKITMLIEGLCCTCKSQ